MRDFFEKRSDPKIRQKNFFFAILLIYSVQYLIFGCLSSKRNYLDNPAYRAQNLDFKWPTSQKRKIAKLGKRLFFSFTKPTLQESSNLPHISVTNTKYNFLDSTIAPNKYSIIQNSKISSIMEISPSNPSTDSSSPQLNELAGMITTSNLTSSMAAIPIYSTNIAAFLAKYKIDIFKDYTKFCTDPLHPMDMTNKKRKAEHDSSPLFVVASAPGFSVKRNIIRQIAYYQRKSALERQYQLLNDAHKDVGVRPSLW